MCQLIISARLHPGSKAAPRLRVACLDYSRGRECGRTERVWSWLLRLDSGSLNPLCEGSGRTLKFVCLVASPPK